MKLVVATTNQGKLRELRELLKDTSVEVVSMKEVLGRDLDIVEDGATFEANAEIKARAVHAATGLATLADDSGLEVDALGGQPGVYSARFSGDGATDATNRAALVRALSNVKDEAPRGRFRCVLALLVPSVEGPNERGTGERDPVQFFRGSCEGHLLREERGENGFGYDPLFVPEEGDGRTMAELEMDMKNRISHRAKAFLELKNSLQTRP